MKSIQSIRKYCSTIKDKNISIRVDELTIKLIEEINNYNLRNNYESNKSFVVRTAIKEYYKKIQKEKE